MWKTKKKENLSIRGEQLARVLLMFVPAVRRDADRWGPRHTCRLGVGGQYREQGRPLWEAPAMFKSDIQSIKEDNIHINHSEHGWNTNLNTKLYKAQKIQV